MMIYCLTFLCFFLLYILFDVNYFIRMACTIGWSRLFHKRRKLLEKTIIYGLCLTSDVDIFLKHMNNARYLRELDFARSCFYDSSGIFAEIRRKGGSVLQTATSIRYRRPIPVFSPYKITAQLVHWDDKSLYIEHEFVSLSDDFVYTTALSKQSVMGPKVHIPDIIEKIEPGTRLPEPSEELSLWLKSIDESSLKFKRIRQDKDSEKNDGEKDDVEVFLSNPA